MHTTKGTAFNCSVKAVQNHVQKLFQLSLRLQPPLTANAPPQMDEAFILDAFVVVLFFETSGGDSE